MRLDSSPAESAEQVCVLACSQAWRPDAPDALVRWFSQPNPDWVLLQQVAAQNRLTPLLAVQLQAFSLPATIRQAWQADYRYNALRNAWLQAEQRQIQQTLQQAGIRLCWLKGAALLAWQIYPNPATRPLADIDVLLPLEQVAAAQVALAPLGYLPLRPAVQAGADLAFENEIQLHKAGKLPLKLELHWYLFDSPFYQQPAFGDWFWQHTVSAPNHTPTFDPPAQLLHLCGHAYLHHSGRELLWLADLALWLQRFADVWDWHALGKQAQALCLLLPMQAALATLAQDWHLPLAQSAHTILKTYLPNRKEVHQYARRNAGRFSVGQRFWLDFWALPSLRQRLQFVGQQLFPAPRYMRARYGVTTTWQLPLAYGRRWWTGLLSLMKGNAVLSKLLGKTRV